MRGPAVTLEDVGKAYGVRGRHTVALEPLTLSVARGEIASLVGRNGAGKTTALKIVSTVVEPSYGRVVVLGHDVVDDPGTVRRLIGTSLASTRSFYWRLTALHNLAFFGRLRGIRGSVLDAEISRVSAELDIERFLRKPTRTLSKGVLARFSLARALLGDPGVLVLDEPLASVDSRGRELVWRALARRARAGGTVLIATHDEGVAALCDRSVTLSTRERRVGNR